MTRLALAILAALVACDASILHPPTGPGTDLPCGERGQVCPNKLCCDESEHCGGEPFSGCPAGYCCYEPASDEIGARRKPHRRPQWKPGEVPSQLEP